MNLSLTWVVWIFYQIQIKSTIAYNLELLGYLLLKKEKSASVGKDMEKNPLGIDDIKEIGTATVENVIEVCQKIKPTMSFASHFWIFIQRYRN